MIELGTTAVYARRLARHAAHRLLLLGAGLGALVVAAWLLAGSRWFLPFLVLAVPAAAVAALGVRRFNVEYLKAASGVRSEARVARRLAAAAPAALVHGVLLGRGDLDHVVLGPMLAVVETKTGRGRLGLDAAGALLLEGRRLPRDPIGQVVDGASRLSRHLGRRVSAVVVVVDATSEPFQSRGVWVCSLRDLPRVLAALPAVLDPVTAASLARRLPVAG